MAAARREGRVMDTLFTETDMPATEHEWRVQFTWEAAWRATAGARAHFAQLLTSMPEDQAIQAHMLFHDSLFDAIYTAQSTMETFRAMRATPETRDEIVPKFHQLIFDTFGSGAEIRSQILIG